MREVEKTLRAMTAIPGLLRAYTDYLTDAQWRWKPSPDQWSVLEVVAHLGDCETNYYGPLLERLAAGEQPAEGGYDPAAIAVDKAFNRMDPDQALEHFEHKRKALAAYLSQVPDQAWQRQWKRSDGSTVTMLGMLRQIAGHDAGHLGQIQRVKRAQRAF
ncbi:MAG: DinB family protein [Thermaerobacterales bacterium]